MTMTTHSPKEVASESGCTNGGCTRSRYRITKYCFRCWAGVKWTSIKQRIENKMGNCNSYVGIPIEFNRDELIHWVLQNPPPPDMIRPSIDRIIPSKGYTLTNIRWLELSKNCSGNQRDVDDGFRICPICKVRRELNLYNFGVNNGRKWGSKFQSYCRTCKNKYDTQWRYKKRLCK